MLNNNRGRNTWLAAGAGLLAGVLFALRHQHQLLTQILAEQKDLRAQIRDESRHQTRQTQALQWLYRELDLSHPLPPMRGWAISPDFAVLLVQLLREHQPHTVLEFGGGTSTIITGAVLRDLGGDCRVIAVEALAPFAEQARATVQQHALADIATVIHAPLRPVHAEGMTFRWYDPQAFAHIDNIDFLTVDGPAQHTARTRSIRYPAYPLLYKRLTDNAVVLLDDANRDDEQNIVKDWLRRYPQLTQQSEERELEKGAAVLRHRWQP